MPWFTLAIGWTSYKTPTMFFRQKSSTSRTGSHLVADHKIPARPGSAPRFRSASFDSRPAPAIPGRALRPGPPTVFWKARCGWKIWENYGKIWGNNHENGRFNENIMRTDYSKTCWYALIRHVSLAGLESGFWPTQNWDVEEKLVIKR